MSDTNDVPDVDREEEPGFTMTDEHGNEMWVPDPITDKNFGDDTGDDAGDQEGDDA